MIIQDLSQARLYRSLADGREAMSIKAILWDFGDTLVDENWMQAPLEGFPGWAEAYRRAMGDSKLADDWNLGRIDMVAVSEALGRDIAAPSDLVLAHMLKACRNITFFDTVMAFARECPLPQAIVTINPDIFSYVVAPHYQLSDTFPVIVTSWEEVSLSKAALCDVALSRLDGNISRSETLLIDNKAKNTDEWIAAGGQSYLFTNEARFEEDKSTLI